MSIFSEFHCIKYETLLRLKKKRVLFAQAPISNLKKIKYSFLYFAFKCFLISHGKNTKPLLKGQQVSMTTTWNTKRRLSLSHMLLHQVSRQTVHIMQPIKNEHFKVNLPFLRGDVAAPSATRSVNDICQAPLWTARNVAMASYSLLWTQMSDVQSYTCYTLTSEVMSQ